MQLDDCATSVDILKRVLMQIVNLSECYGNILRSLVTYILSYNMRDEIVLRKRREVKMCRIRLCSFDWWVSNVTIELGLATFNLTNLPPCPIATA